ncbi:hypothetical protein [Hyphomonas sp. UBA4494]|jgi:hypothetical protein|uniref:hypothetical protein n=1 Tax=Hyphomonas sp. UBA4494 TaxID=1946631 RepID=UPI0025C32AEC|nr:hypothetical protein [Hyphomonas sp. UBA4494]
MFGEIEHLRMIARHRARIEAEIVAPLQRRVFELLKTTQEQNVPPAPTGGDQTVPPSGKPE